MNISHIIHKKISLDEKKNRDPIFPRGMHCCTGFFFLVFVKLYEQSLL